MAKAAKSKIEKTASKAVTVVKSNPNTLLFAGGVVAAIYLAIKLNSGVNAVGDAFTNSTGGIPVKVDPKQPPSGLNDLQAKAKADRLYTAMQADKNGLPGTDVTALMNELRGISQNDYVKIYAAFGKRSYNPITGEGSVLWSKLDLTEWITEELSTSEFARLRQMLPNIF